MITCYIIDDEQHAIDTLISYIEKSPDLTLLGSSINPVTGLAQIKSELAPDVVFLDVDMPELSGIEVAGLLPSQTLKVFTTAFTNYALDAFEVNAIDFLLKPISFAKFLKMVDKVKHALPEKSATVSEASQSSIFINPGVRGKMLQIHFDEILYVEGLKNYVIIHTANAEKHITYLTMNEITAALPESKFIRIHKSYIINLKKIQTIEGNSVKLTERIEIPIGTSHRDKFMMLISQLTVKTARK